MTGSIVTGGGRRVVHVGAPVIRPCARAGWVMVLCPHGHVTNILPEKEWRARRITELVCFEADK